MWSTRDDPRYPWDPAFDPKELSESEAVETVIAVMETVVIPNARRLEAAARAPGS